MSYSSPTPEEASEIYYHYRDKYTDAANRRSASIRQEAAYAAEKSAAKSQMNALSGQKLNFEERLEGIERIIRMLDGSGGWALANVPEAIARAVGSVRNADSSYRQSIRMTGGVAAASLENAFRAKTVDEDPNTAYALQRYRAEKASLEQKIAELNTQIASLSSLISSLNSKINACNADQSALQHTMNTSAYEMNHYKRYMYG